MIAMNKQVINHEVIAALGKAAGRLPAGLLPQSNKKKCKHTASLEVRAVQGNHASTVMQATPSKRSHARMDDAMKVIQAAASKQILANTILRAGVVQEIPR